MVITLYIQHVSMLLLYTIYRRCNNIILFDDGVGYNVGGARKRRNAAKSELHTQFIGIPYSEVYAFNLDTTLYTSSRRKANGFFFLLLKRLIL